MCLGRRRKPSFLLQLPSDLPAGALLLTNTLPTFLQDTMSSSFAGNSQPSHVTTLSGKVNNLRFMQRANAQTQQQQQHDASPEISSSSSPTISKAAKFDGALANKVVSNALQSLPLQVSGSLTTGADSNAEHWTLVAPSLSESSSVTLLEPTNSEGWNSWLISRGESGFGGLESRQRHRSRRGSESNTENINGKEEAFITSAATVGRRKFGNFASESADDEGDDEAAQYPEYQDRKRQKATWARSLSPEVEYDSQGQLRMPASGKSSQQKSVEQALTMRKQISEKKRQVHSQQGRFLKLGSGAKRAIQQRKADGHSSDSDDSQVGREDLDVPFADNDLSMTSASSSNRKSSQRGKKSRAKRNKSTQ